MYKIICEELDDSGDWYQLYAVEYDNKGDLEAFLSDELMNDSETSNYRYKVYQRPPSDWIPLAISIKATIN